MRSMPFVLTFAAIACACACGGAAPPAASEPATAPHDAPPAAPSPAPSPDGASGSAASAADAPAPVASASAPAPPKPEPTEPYVAKLELRGPAKARAGERVIAELVNVDTRAHAFHHPGGSDGCAGFDWDFRVRDALGRRFTHVDPEFGRGCGQGLVQPRWIVIEPGERVEIDLRTDQPMWRVGVTKQTPSVLAPGKYTFEVSGAGGGPWKLVVDLGK